MSDIVCLCVRACACVHVRRYTGPVLDLFATSLWSTSHRHQQPVNAPHYSVLVLWDWLVKVVSFIYLIGSSKKIMRGPLC